MLRAARKINKQKIATIVITSIFLIGGMYFLHPFDSESSYAAEHKDEASGKYNGTTYSLTTTVSDLNLELKTLPTGNSTYGAQTVNVTTTAPGGYELYVNTSGVLTNTSDSNSTIPSITGSNQALDMNTWGYTDVVPNEDGDTAGSQSIWNTTPTTLTKIDSSTSAVTNKEKTLYYGIKADNTLADGTYTGTITYTTVANDAASDTLLSVSPTSGTTGTATTITVTTSLMTTVDGISASDISAKVENYDCTFINITSTAPLTFTCKTSTSLAAGTYTVTVTISKYGKTYIKTNGYKVSNVEDFGATNMQTSNVATLCKNAKATISVSDAHTYELTDTRNSQKYYIRKFTYGPTSYCIMVENLYLVGGTKLTNASSNVSSNYTLPSSSTSGFSSDTTAYMYNGGADVNAARKRNGATYDGSYYSWIAATANTGSNSGYDICPKYWHIFTIGEADTINTMINNVGITTFYADKDGKDASAILPGDYYNDNLVNNGSNAFWWSSTQYPSGNARAYRLHSYANGLGTYYDNNKRAGFSVRCLVLAAS